MNNRQELLLHLSQCAGSIVTAANLATLKGGSATQLRHVDAQVVHLQAVVRAMRKLGVGMQFTRAESQPQLDYYMRRYGNDAAGDAA